ncbi:glycogen synthase GlgA [Acidovorax sp. BLS4]|uniref:glycogen synthase GlgA n=1 Tax=Acidovorax sp. BLS4 TaxID=3273430 RepID=UPI0029427558|nr:glycogen synthase GlgA [Paracidovorax avenae]WOI46652.1 glycogen synthase GlgA [Paracidovorax avenae]
MKVLFVTPECAPLVKTGGLGDVSAALPRALAAMGHDVALLMPAYGDMAITGQIVGLSAIAPRGAWPAAQLLQLRQEDGFILYLLSCPQLYARAGTPYGAPSGTDHDDNALRFGLLSQVAAMMGTQATPCGWQADIVHANDWPTGLAPFYLAQARAVRDGAPVARSVITVHNLAFQGVFPMHACDALEIPPEHRGIAGVEFWGGMSMLKAGLNFADAITTVSPTYAREIQGPELGFGLDGVLRERSNVLYGILNGVDTNIWNPASDPLIAAPYSLESPSGKALNKIALRQRCGLDAAENRMLFGLVGRLTQQKGVDLVVEGAERLVKQGAQLVVLGNGDTAIQARFTQMAARYPEHISVTLGFDESLAHQIEAGADCFLMPSRFEPCGLNQMYSQIYGTPPIVTHTGGLADSVVDADSSPSGGTGFIMQLATQEMFDEAVQRAIAAWQSPVTWESLQRAGMRQTFGWDASAKAYSDLYGELLES